MAELYDSATHQDPRDIEELPASVNTYHYTNMDDYLRIILSERQRLYRSFPATSGSDEKRQDEQTEGTQTDHIIFIIEPLTFAHDFLNSESQRPFHDKLSFDPNRHILVVKMPCKAHEQLAVAFDDMLKISLQPMGLHRAIFSWHSTTLTAQDGSIKEADGGWSPRRPPRGALKRPSVILEVASSETAAKLRLDAHYWVDPARGQANIAIGVKVHVKKPHITIEVWEWDDRFSRPTRTQYLAITKSDEKIRFDPNPNPQIMIPFHLLFRRPAENIRERDIVFATQDLVEFATMVWDMEFDYEQE
ncbi:hypothetical protein N7466_002064 [Penicillium verhagenii]|uniref:uncharacterized protein n=1 Tax=Penicillium verhagenii TaxID=1562060 RepID=UPI0025459B26|nr:uncharacterized protein N7466_002064 [Penicillium verhagenii]KAJ5938930.1 hypothetical protein N7466_002064 [Penicillium verhagenii]